MCESLELLFKRLIYDFVINRFDRHVMRGHQIKPITLTKYYEEETTTTESARPQLMSSSAQQPQHGILSSPKHAGTASNATRELDDLMASLSDFKVMLK
jgi:hypothetical protein